MPSVPLNITDLQHPDAVNTINKNFNTVVKRLDDLEKASASKRLSAQPSLHFGTVAANSCAQTVLNILGASTTLVAHANPILFLGSNNLTWSAFVSAAGQVTVRISNPTSSPIVVNTVRWNILVA